jgi:hypothetical protein
MTRRLYLSEWPSFEALHKREFPGDPVPTPTQAMVVIEEQGGEIVGFLVARYMPVIGPWWTKPGHGEGFGVAKRLVEKLMAETPEVSQAVTFTKDHRVARLHRILGLREEGFASSWRK